MNKHFLFFFGKIRFFCVKQKHTTLSQNRYELKVQIIFIIESNEVRDQTSIFSTLIQIESFCLNKKAKDVLFEAIHQNHFFGAAESEIFDYNLIYSNTLALMAERLTRVPRMRKRFATVSTSTQVTLFPWHYDAEMGTANSLHASA